MTISGIGFQENNLQILRAQNAFQKTLKNVEETQKAVKSPQQEDVKVSISSQSLHIEAPTISTQDNRINAGKSDPYIGEIKEFASKHNLDYIEDEEIEDALKYGTSLLADYTA